MEVMKHQAHEDIMAYIYSAKPQTKPTSVWLRLGTEPTSVWLSLGTEPTSVPPSLGLNQHLFG